MALFACFNRNAAASYGWRLASLQGLIAAAGLFVSALLPASAADAPVRIVCLGDSLTAGYQLPPDAAFPAVLQKALRARGLKVDVANAGVSGDTSTGGLERLDWVVPEGTDIVILELGANDMLRGLDPAIPERALDTIVRRLQGRNIRVLLAGMLSADNYGKEYRRRFEGIFPALAQKYQLPFYPFFLEGVSTLPGMTLPDGLHPSRAGVETIVKGILPLAVAEVEKDRAVMKPASGCLIRLGEGDGPDQSPIICFLAVGGAPVAEKPGFIGIGVQRQILKPADSGI